MKKIKLKRFVITVVIMLACYLLQCTLFPSLELASVKPNLLLIVTAAILYQLILWINQKLEAEEKRSASKFV